MNLSNIDWKKPTTIIAVVVATLAVFSCALCVIVALVSKPSTPSAETTVPTVLSTATAIPPTAEPTQVPAPTITPCNQDVGIWASQLNPVLEDWVQAQEQLNNMDVKGALSTVESVQIRLDAIESPSCEPRAREAQRLFRESTNKFVDAIIYAVAGDEAMAKSNMEMAISLQEESTKLIKQIADDIMNP